MKPPFSQALPYWKLDSQQCRLLLALEMAGSLKGLAQVVQRDASVVARQLKRIAEEVPAVEKKLGRWSLTPLGLKINQWSRAAIDEQRKLLGEPTSLTLACGREFAARVLIPGWREILASCAQARPRLVTCEETIEQLLVEGKADLGVEAGRPQDPSVRFRVVRKEPCVVVGSPRRFTGGPTASLPELLEAPALACLGWSLAEHLHLNHEGGSESWLFSDLSSVRAAAISGLGWAILPEYAVRDEIAQGKLSVVYSGHVEPLVLGIWWSRERKGLSNVVDRLAQWLARIPQPREATKSIRVEPIAVARLAGPEEL